MRNGDTATWSPSRSGDSFVLSPLADRVEGPCLEFGPRIFSLASGDNLVGREAGSVVRLDSASVSRRHACIAVSPSGTTIEDLGSRNGTIVGDSRIQDPTEIHDGDAIRIGTVWLLYRAPRDGDLEDD